MLAGELQADREAEVRNEGERVGRVDRERRQNRKDRLFELCRQPLPVGVAEGAGTYEQDVFLGEILLQNGERSLLLHLQIVDLPQNGVELFSRRLAVRRADDDVLAHLPLEAGDAHHEELVEVGGRNRQEADTLKQRMLGVQGFLKNAAVELQPGEFAVDEAFGTAEQHLPAEGPAPGLQEGLPAALRLHCPFSHPLSFA